MLNGSHSMLAYLGQLADCELVSDAVSSDGLRAAVAGLMAADVAPTLVLPAGFDLDAYQRDLMRRYANPALRHRTAQITMDGGRKPPSGCWGRSATGGGRARSRRWPSWRSPRGCGS